MARTTKVATDNKRQLADQVIHYLGKPLESLTEREMRIFQGLVERQTIARNVNRVFDDKLTFGQRLADKVAEFGGSWAFIIVFAALLAIWVSINLLAATHAIDPYPFIFLNLILSMIAALQAPIIMMSQNRQTSRDRLDAGHDYEVNLKAEIEIMALHDKLDQMRSTELRSLIEKQQEQIELLTKFMMGNPK
ncbi:DUF1003 domain-containing protein [Ochrobactrum pecoris]|uniref:DUF1003 domain-containing protein n=1 Tax=Brucella pecoris TaxID=867683 RepID=A0A5C5CCA6_9HYPH|nr:DUF1003 domain-containing protein [Brucella pecoris]MBB4096093.1 putative membrane protein [Brucella pecoris]NKW79455.1 DUF1003 domain-containing protein [Brucella pecoris]TNV08912.1 DUF1003 domain-containing protein [Brucella pecoris]